MISLNAVDKVLLKHSYSPRFGSYSLLLRCLFVGGEKILGFCLFPRRILHVSCVSRGKEDR